jgi:sensor histidine kinase YesM
MVGKMTPPNPRWGDFFSGKNFIKFLLVISFPHWGLGGCFAQRLPYTFDQMKVGNSTLENQVNCLLKDRNGYLWIGTASGLKRYDSEFTITLKKKTNDEHSLVNNNVETLCEDNQGRIWVGTTTGICYFDKKKNHFVRFKELNKPDFACLNIICDSKGDIWFTIRDKGLYHFDIKTKRLRNFSHYDKVGKKISLNRVYRHGLIEDPSKKGIWIACSNGLNFFDFNSQNIYNQEFNPKNISILNLNFVSAFTIQNNYFVFSDNASKEIIWYDLESQKKVKSFKPISNSAAQFTGVYKLFFDINGDLWMSVFGDMMFYVDFQKHQTIKIVYEKGNNNSFSAHNFLDAFQEKNGTIWFATRNGISTINGMAALKPNEQLFENFDFSKTIFKNYPIDGFHGFAEDQTDSTSWWMITLQNRLVHYNPVTNQFKDYVIPIPKRLPNDVYGLYMNDYHNKIFIFKSYSCFIFDKTTRKFSELALPEKISPKQNYSITHTKILGDSLWVFAVNLEVVYNYHLVKKQWKSYPLIVDVAKKIGATKRGFGVNFSLISSIGEFWIALHSGGLAKFDTKKQAFIGIKTKQDIDFAKVGFTGFAEDKNGKFWLGTYDLIKFDPKTYDFQTAFEKDWIGSLTIDNNGNICMASLDEMMFFNEEKNEKYTFTLQSNEPFYTWSNWLINLKNNKIVSLNKQGLALINFKNMKISSFKDQLYINRIATTDTAILIHENNTKLNFTSKQNSFSIYFGLLTPPNTYIYEISYMMEGYDKNWVADNENKKSAIYGQLDGGDYVFKVRAVDSNKKVLPIQTLHIHIETPFYKTWWFIMIIGLFTAYLLYAFVRYRGNQRKKIHHLQIQSTRLEKDKTEIQYQNLINHLNPHFLFNSLTSLNGLILSEPDIASDFLQKLSKIYRYILQNKDTEIVSLDQELGFVKNYIDLQKSRFDEGLQVNIAIDDNDLSSGIVPVTLQNLFENAIKHNTVEEDKPLIIDVFVEDNYLIVKNNLQKKKFVETSNKQGLDSLKSLYKYLTTSPLETIETEREFVVRVPLL